MPDNERVKGLEVRMELVERGVANFREFQTDARDFFSRSDEREKMRDDTNKRRARVHFALLGGLISLVVGLILLFAGWANDFEKRHKISEAPHTPVQSSENPPN
jgi:hypothetical protein